MNRISAGAVVLLCSLAVCVACGSQLNTEQKTAGPSAKETASVKGDESPTYEEIQRYVNRLTKTPYPEGLPVGLDGLQDADLEKAIGVYSASIKGTQVVDWRGWYIGHDLSEGRPNSPARYYSVYVFMREPGPADKNVRQVQLYVDDPSEEDAHQIESLQHGQALVFSGTVLGVDPYGLVFVEKGTLRTRDSKTYIRTHVRITAAGQQDGQTRVELIITQAESSW